MIIEASARPKRLKRGKEKEFWTLMEKFGMSQDLSKMCARLTLSGDDPQQFKFLRDMYKVFTDGGTIILHDKADKQISKYTNIHPSDTMQSGKRDPAQSIDEDVQSS